MPQISKLKDQPHESFPDFHQPSENLNSLSFVILCRIVLTVFQGTYIRTVCLSLSALDYNPP